MARKKQNRQMMGRSAQNATAAVWNRRWGGICSGANLTRYILVNSGQRDEISESTYLTSTPLEMFSRRSSSFNVPINGDFNRPLIPANVDDEAEPERELEAI